MKRVMVCTLLAVLVLVTASCTAGPNALSNSPDEDGKVAGFWQGVWHGIISPVTFIISLFAKKIQIYEVHNNGGWYNFGFLLGLSIIFGGSGGATGRAKR